MNNVIALLYSSLSENNSQWNRSRFFLIEYTCIANCQKLYNILLLIEWPFKQYGI